ncbi:MAG: hypothetical protein AAFV88_08130 [Planctomycetota bacterium]
MAAEGAVPADSLETLFPLRLAPMEHFLLLDDRPECPLTPFVELHFTSQLDRDAFNQSLAVSIRRHPLLASRVVWKDGFPHWQFDASFQPSLVDVASHTVLTTSDEQRWCIRPFDLEHETGSRFWYETLDAGGKCRVIVQVHHAVCDGVGIRQFLIDVLFEYDRRTGEPAKQTSPSPRRERVAEPKRLEQRADFTRIEQTPANVKLRWWQKLRNAYYFYLQPPQALARPHADDACEGDLPNEPLCHHFFDAPTSELTLEKCRLNGVRLNDVALSALFLTCRWWNERCGITRRGTRIRLLMPTDLRERRDLRLPAANRLSFSFLGRTHHQLGGGLTQVLETIRAETQQIKDTRVYMDFLKGLRSVSKYPQRFRRAVDGNRNMATAVMTYAGDLARGLTESLPKNDGRLVVGDTEIERVVGAPPARENTNLTFGVYRNWGRIGLSVSWSRKELSRADARVFLEQFASELKRWGESGS